MQPGKRRYIGLFGSHSGDWRALCSQRLDAAGVAWFDPTDPRWQGINADNGDEQQELIDELVAEQHRGMRDAACVIYHLASRRTYRLAYDELPADAGAPVAALAARCELGFLTGRGIPTFAHIEPDVTGRNYLWAQMRPYEHMVRCATLDDALTRALDFMRAAPL